MVGVNDDPFLNKTKFQMKIEQITRDKRCSYIDAVMLFCEDNHIDLEDVSKLISTNLKDKIKLDAQEEGYFPKTAKLPI